MTGEAGKQRADWEVVEKHYRAGLKSLRTIADEAGVTEGAIRKRAKKDGWTRNLDEKIQQRAKEKVRKETVRTPSTQLTPATEKEVVEQYSDVVASVDMIQREDLKLAIDTNRSMLNELALLGHPDFKGLLTELGELMYDPQFDKNGNEKPDKALEAYRYIISLAGRVKMAKEIAGAYGVYAPFQRKVFGLDVEKKSSGEFEDMLRNIQLEV